MNSVEKWLPSKSKVSLDSYVWHIEKFSKKIFDIYEGSWRRSTDHTRSVVKFLRSPMFALSVMQEGSLNKANLYLWLMRDATEHDGVYTYNSTWLQVGLSASLHDPPKSGGVSQQVTDCRNVCMVCIAGKQRQCITRLAGSSYRSLSNPNFVLYDDLFDEGRGLLCDDELSVVCEVYAFANETRFVRSWLYDPLKPEVVYRMEHTLLDDLKRMLQTGQGSDITLVANDGREFPAHVSILSSRSPVMAAMFEHDMTEKQEKRVTIDDLSSQAVAGLLEFIYTDIVTDITTLAPELLPAAQKYDISRMKTLCEEAMVSELKIENAAEFLFLADLLEASQLRAAAKRFSVTYFYAVKKSEGWKKLQSEKPQLAEEVIDELAELTRQLTLQ